MFGRRQPRRRRRECFTGILMKFSAQRNRPGFRDGATLWQIPRVARRIVGIFPERRRLRRASVRRSSADRPAWPTRHRPPSSFRAPRPGRGCAPEVRAVRRRPGRSRHRRPRRLARARSCRALFDQESPLGCGRAPGPAAGPQRAVLVSVARGRKLPPSGGVRKSRSINSSIA